ncbi:MAG TPA: V-type ATPase subunit subunit G family protein [Spirochaetia bacterium]|nr:V-type ATPase subunit subunit G family protein [Spirochaetia bacterium]
MAKKKLREKQELDSLIPSIKSAEKNLDDLLEGARAEAAELIQSTETEAARRIQRSREETPALLARERESRMVSLRARAAEVREAALEENRRLEKKAAEGMEAAVRLIVSRVWPGAEK